MVAVRLRWAFDANHRALSALGISLELGFWDLELPTAGFPFDSRFRRWQGVGSI